MKADQALLYPLLEPIVIKVKSFDVHNYSSLDKVKEARYRLDPMSKLRAKLQKSRLVQI